MSGKERNKENVYAYKGDQAREADIVHISKVPYSERGRGGGYYCLGCKRQMQAVKSTKGKRRSYFRHDAIINKGNGSCTYSDETYRHKLSKDILQGMKRVKVPSVYKYSPVNKNGKAFLIKDAEYIDAHTVLIEHSVYEDENGQITVAKAVESPESKGLIVKPDVTFLDVNGNPILLIEIVATHKPKQDKLIKMKRLGIDAIQISIPKDSPENIERTFHTTSRTKWIYNGEEERTDYVQLSESHGDGVFTIDELQRRFFEENFKCRSSQIRELIRAIERVLEAEHYQRLEGNLRSEIRRVERNTERDQGRLEKLRKDHGAKGAAEHKERRGLLEREQIEFQKYFKGLEERYLRKRRELVDEEARIEAEIAEVEFKLQGVESGTKGISEAIEREREAIYRVEVDIEDLRFKLDRLPERHRLDGERVRERIRIKEDQVDSDTERIQRLIDTAPEVFRNEEEGLEREHDSYRTRINNQINEIGEEERGVEREYNESRERIESKYAGIRERISQDIVKGGYQGSRWFTQEYAGLGGLKAAILANKEVREFYDRLREVDKLGTPSTRQN